MARQAAETQALSPENDGTAANEITRCLRISDARAISDAPASCAHSTCFCTSAADTDGRTAWMALMKSALTSAGSSNSAAGVSASLRAPAHSPRCPGRVRRRHRYRAHRPCSLLGASVAGRAGLELALVARRVRIGHRHLHLQRQSSAQENRAHGLEVRRLHELANRRHDRLAVSRTLVLGSSYRLGRGPAGSRPARWERRTLRSDPL